MKKNRIIALLMTGTVALSTLLAGTYAWRSMNQQAKNEVLIQANPGGRLHDDFTGLRWNSTDTNLKNVYVENFTGTADGAKIYARIRLDEYLELGLGAGKAEGTQGKEAKSIVTTNPDNNKTVKIGDKSSWITYKWDGNSSIFRQYVTLNTGGKTTYLPTYNKNKDSLDADINGTLAGTDGSNETLLDAYEDYEKYTVGTSYSSIEISDADEDSYDEISMAGLTTKQVIDALWDAENNLYQGSFITGAVFMIGRTEVTVIKQISENGVLKEVWLDLDDNNPPNGSEADGADIRIEILDAADYHSGQPTLEADFISMDDWLSADTENGGKNKAPGDYWVYDTDGWVYWANPIEPQTATGCLINSITCANQELMAGEYYYGLNVVAQFATAGDWGKAADTVAGTAAEGFYIDNLSTNALKLLNTIAATEAQ